jgi:hypothetical protein
VTTRSAALLKSLVARGAVDAADLANALVCSPEHVESCLAGTVVLSLEQQLCLALYVIEHVPKFARRGHTLRAQVAAAMKFAAHETRVHSEPPGRWI